MNEKLIRYFKNFSSLFASCRTAATRVPMDTLSSPSGWRGRADRSQGAPSSVSARSRSRKTSDSGASLLSNSNLELVLDLIDDYYQRSVPSQHVADTSQGGSDFSALLGNIGPSKSAAPPPLSKGLAPPADARAPLAPPACATVATGSGGAGGAPGPASAPMSASCASSASTSTMGFEENQVVARALVAATSDGKRLEELLRILDSTGSYARHRTTATRSELSQLEIEVADTREQLRELLRELREIHHALVSEMRHSELTCTLARLVRAHTSASAARLPESAQTKPSLRLPTHPDHTTRHPSFPPCSACRRPLGRRASLRILSFSARVTTWPRARQVRRSALPSTSSSRCLCRRNVRLKPRSRPSLPSSPSRLRAAVAVPAAAAPSQCGRSPGERRTPLMVHGRAWG